MFEHAAFTVFERHEQAPLEGAPGHDRRVAPRVLGLMSSWLTRRDDDSWLVVILRPSREHAEYSARHITEAAEALA